MNILEENGVRWALQMLLGLTCLSVLMTTLLAVFILLRRPRSAAGWFCSQCGRTLPKDPTQAIALGDKSYFVYNCTACGGETILNR